MLELPCAINGIDDITLYTVHPLNGAVYTVIPYTHRLSVPQ